MNDALKNMADELHLVSIGPGDHEFLRRLYVSTREDILNSRLPPELKRQLAEFQFQAQHDYYRRQFAGADFDLICRGGEPIGRLYVFSDKREIHLIEILLLPGERGKGIGTSLIGDLLVRSERDKLPVRLRVERNNPAMRLYMRLGFRVIADEQVHLHMEWQPKSSESKENWSIVD